MFRHKNTRFRHFSGSSFTNFTPLLERQNPIQSTCLKRLYSLWL
jgi:hypothetical protein